MKIKIRSLRIPFEDPVQVKPSQGWYHLALG